MLRYTRIKIRNSKNNDIQDLRGKPKLEKTTGGNEHRKFYYNRESQEENLQEIQSEKKRRTKLVCMELFFMCRLSSASKPT
jgi:hypothetical protein